MKIKMTCRHTASTGKKLEKGLIYDFPLFYAQKLIDHGLAVPVIEVIPAAPGFVPINQRPRSKTGKFSPRGGKK